MRVPRAGDARGGAQRALRGASGHAGHAAGLRGPPAQQPREPGGREHGCGEGAVQGTLAFEKRAPLPPAGRLQPTPGPAAAAAPIASAHLSSPKMPVFSLPGFVTCLVHRPTDLNHAIPSTPSHCPFAQCPQLEWIIIYLIAGANTGEMVYICTCRRTPCSERPRPSGWRASRFTLSRSQTKRLVTCRNLPRTVFKRPRPRSRAAGGPGAAGGAVWNHRRARRRGLTTRRRMTRRHGMTRRRRRRRCRPGRGGHRTLRGVRRSCAVLDRKSAAGRYGEATRQRAAASSVFSPRAGRHPRARVHTCAGGRAPARLCLRTAGHTLRIPQHLQYTAAAPGPRPRRGRCAHLCICACVESVRAAASRKLIAR